MRTQRGEPLPDYFAPVAIGLLVVIAVACAAFLGGIWLFQPTVLPNHGMAAYEPPVGTYLIPPPHKMDAPELALLPPLAAEPEPPPAATAAEPTPAAAKPKAKTARRQTKPHPQRGDPRHAYADGRWGDTWGNARVNGTGGGNWGSAWGGGGRRGGWSDNWSNRW